MKFFFGLFLFSLSLNASPVISPFATEGVMTFKTTVFMPRSFVPANSNPNQRLPLLIHEQTKHLLGVFEQVQFAKLNHLPLNDNVGALGLGTLIDYRLISVTKSSVEEGWEITYVARHKILVRKDVLSPGGDLSITVIVPHNPVEFYVKACTDKEYYEKVYLFYYWNPYDLNCSVNLKGSQNSVNTIVAQIHGLPGSQPQASPDYNALKNQMAKRSELRIALLFGFNLTSRNPKDEGRLSYERLQKYFESNHFTVSRENNRPSPQVQYVRSAGQGRLAVRVLMSASPSDIDTPVTFARRAREAFETADIVMYIGHSGLGGNLNLDMITRLSSPDQNHPVPINFPNAYQIYYIDSCASFFFYSEEYAMTRRGIHNVDIITNGTASYFWTQNSEVLHFLNAFVEPDSTPTWSEILTSVATQARTFSYMPNVSAIR